MTLNELLAHTRGPVLRDTAVPVLWTDAELTLYLNEAYRLFCVRTHCLVDSTSDFTTFELEPGIALYALDARIHRVNRLGLVTEDDTVDPPVQNYSELVDGTRNQVPRVLYQGRPTTFTMQSSIGPDEVVSTVSGTGRNILRFYPVPDEALTVIMTVARGPLAALSADDDEPEIEEIYQLALCDYAAWRALSNNDAERANMQAAGPFRASFDMTVRDAKRDLAVLRSGESPQARNNWTGKILRRWY
jgi:hypothetical protein